MKVPLLHFDDCPGWQTTDQHLRQSADDFDTDRRRVDTPEAADELQFRGSRPVLLDVRRAADSPC